MSKISQPQAVALATFQAVSSYSGQGDRRGRAPVSPAAVTWAESLTNHLFAPWLAQAVRAAGNSGVSRAVGSGTTRVCVKHAACSRGGLGLLDATLAGGHSLCDLSSTDSSTSPQRFAISMGQGPSGLDSASMIFTPGPPPRRPHCRPDPAFCPAKRCEQSALLSALSCWPVHHLLHGAF